MAKKKVVEETPAPAAKAHVSYSQINDWQECGKKYQLRKILGLPEKPAWWNIGGHAVHSATETLDREQFELVGY